jgi:hypothetical protein
VSTSAAAFTPIRNKGDGCLKFLVLGHKAEVVTLSSCPIGKHQAVIRCWWLIDDVLVEYHLHTSLKTDQRDVLLCSVIAIA